MSVPPAEVPDPGRTTRLGVLVAAGAAISATDRPDSLTIGGTGKGQCQVKIYVDAADPEGARAIVDAAIALAAYAQQTAAAAGVGQ